MPKFERVYVQDAKDKSKLRELTDLEINQLYHSKDSKEKAEAWGALFNSFPSGDCNVKRILHAIGEVPGRCVPFSLKLTYFENVNSLAQESFVSLSPITPMKTKEPSLEWSVTPKKDRRVQ